MSKNLSNQEIKLKYLIDYWREFAGYSEDKINKISYFSNLEQDSINPILYNPKELFKEFIDEIERKNLSNSDNKDFFRKNVNNLIDLKLEALKFLESTLKIIQQQFSKKDDFSYLLYVLKFALDEMSDFRLGKECVKELSKILFNDKEFESNDKENMKHLVRFIVFELQHKGFSDKTIHKIINDIFASYHPIQDNIIQTKFPHNFEFSKEPTQENKEKYYKNLKDYMDSLTSKDRIESLNNYFNSKTFSVKFIFRINGIKGKENLQVGDIEIYNPIQKQLIEQGLDNKLECDETFGLKNDAQKNMYQSEICNIAIKEDIIDTDSEFGKYKAVLKANAFFDCFISRSFYIGTKITLDTTQYIVLNDKNREIGRGFSMPEKFLSYQDSKYAEEFINNSENNYLQYYAKLIEQNELIKIDKQISESLVWKRKALEATNYNEAILWYWVSIENLFNSHNSATKFIFHFAPKILTKVYIYHFMQQIHIDILNKSFPFRDDNLSEETRNIIHNMPKNMTYKEFIEKVKEIRESLDKHSFFYDKLKSFIAIFENKEQFKNFIENYKKQMEQKLTFLYRIRNKIAHSANNEYSATITYYKNFARHINTHLTCYFIDERIQGFKTNEEIIHYGTYEYNKMLLDLEKYGIDSIINPKDSNEKT
ncbi:hypothetical protein [Helicobacter ganmani]|uniref:hypothetical protein n=1 Tax=Helicobacter ganmani TaxID=60246 RepID=UPI003A896D2E